MSSARSEDGTRSTTFRDRCDTSLRGVGGRLSIDNELDRLYRAGRRTIILALSVATAILLGAIAAWAATCAGGRHRDGAPLPEWMAHPNLLQRRRTALR